MADRNIVGFSANTDRPSLTGDLLEAVTRTAGAALSASTEVFDLSEIDESLRAAPFRTALEGPARRALTCVERADALIVGAPTTKAGSYPGLLHHFFDLADPALLRGKPVVVVATGGLGANPRLVKLQLRLLFRVLGARPVPTAIYADKSELRGALAQSLMDRIVLANAELAKMLIAEPGNAGTIAGESKGATGPIMLSMWRVASPHRRYDVSPAHNRRRPRLSLVR